MQIIPYNRAMMGCLYRCTFYLIYLALGCRFLLAMFEPGTTYTAPVFEMLEPALPAIDQILSTLMYPITWSCAWLQSLLPAYFQYWFPQVQAEIFISAITDPLFLIPGFASSALGQELSGPAISYEFPGIIDWRYLIAIAIMFILENTLLILGSMLQDIGSALRHRLQMMKMKLGHQQQMSDIELFQKLLKQQRTAPDQEQEKRRVTGMVREVISDFREEIIALQGKVNKDEMTGLYNKKFFMQNLELRFQHARDNNRDFGLIDLGPV